MATSIQALSQTVKIKPIEISVKQHSRFNDSFNDLTIRVRNLVVRFFQAIIHFFQMAVEKVSHSFGKKNHVAALVVNQKNEVIVAPAPPKTTMPIDGSAANRGPVVDILLPGPLPTVVSKEALPIENSEAATLPISVITESTKPLDIARHVDHSQELGVTIKKADVAAQGVLEEHSTATTPARTVLVGICDGSNTTISNSSDASSKPMPLVGSDESPGLSTGATEVSEVKKPRIAPATPVSLEEGVMTLKGMDSAFLGEELHSIASDDKALQRSVSRRVDAPSSDSNVVGSATDAALPMTSAVEGNGTNLDGESLASVKEQSMPQALLREVLHSEAREEAQVEESSPRSSADSSSSRRARISPVVENELLRAPSLSNVVVEELLEDGTTVVLPSIRQVKPISMTSSENTAFVMDILGLYAQLLSLHANPMLLTDGDLSSLSTAAKEKAVWTSFFKQVGSIQTIFGNSSMLQLTRSGMLKLTAGAAIPMPHENTALSARPILAPMKSPTFTPSMHIAPGVRYNAEQMAMANWVRMRQRFTLPTTSLGMTQEMGGDTKPVLPLSATGESRPESTPESTGVRAQATSFLSRFSLWPRDSGAVVALSAVDVPAPVPSSSGWGLPLGISGFFGSSSTVEAKPSVAPSKPWFSVPGLSLTGAKEVASNTLSTIQTTATDFAISSGHRALALTERGRQVAHDAVTTASSMANSVVAVPGRAFHRATDATSSMLHTGGDVARAVGSSMVHAGGVAFDFVINPDHLQTAGNILHVAAVVMGDGNGGNHDRLGRASAILQDSVRVGHELQRLRRSHNLPELADAAPDDTAVTGSPQLEVEDSSDSSSDDEGSVVSSRRTRDFRGVGRTVANHTGFIAGVIDEVNYEQLQIRDSYSNITTLIEVISYASLAKRHPIMFPLGKINDIFKAPLQSIYDLAIHPIVQRTLARGVFGMRTTHLLYPISWSAKWTAYIYDTEYDSVQRGLEINIANLDARIQLAYRREAATFYANSTFLSRINPVRMKTKSQRDGNWAQSAIEYGKEGVEYIVKCLEKPKSQAPLTWFQRVCSTVDMVGRHVKNIAPALPVLTKPNKRMQFLEDIVAIEANETMAFEVSQEVVRPIFTALGTAVLSSIFNIPGRVVDFTCRIPRVADVCVAASQYNETGPWAYSWSLTAIQVALVTITLFQVMSAVKRPYEVASIVSEAFATPRVAGTKKLTPMDVLHQVNASRPRYEKKATWFPKMRSGGFKHAHR